MHGEKIKSRRLASDVTVVQTLGDRLEVQRMEGPHEIPACVEKQQ